MKKIFSILFCLSIFLTTPVMAAAWKPETPEGYTPITWVKGNGIASFTKAPDGNGYLDFLTVINLATNQIKLVSSSTPKTDWGAAKAPFDWAVSSLLDMIKPDAVHNWAFARTEVEKIKTANPNIKFLWNAPFFNLTVTTTDLSLSLKSTDNDGVYVTSGSRPDKDMAQARKMLIIDNKTGIAKIGDFDAKTFITDGDQAVEGFSALENNKGSDPSVARLFIGVKPGGKELVIYCSQGARPGEAREALAAAGVPVENMLQADGGTSATCAYNLPGQYFVEPGRTLPHLMGAETIVLRGKVNTDILNVRSAPNTKGSITQKLKKGDPIVAYENKNGWYRISGTEWVFATYVKAY